MERIILHSDLNNFYASVECLYRPEIRNKPVAVCGDPEQRHGITLAKNYIAKKYGVQTGDPLWMAKQKCPDIIFVPPNFKRYMQYSRLAKEIYAQYTSQVEPFGLDECWLDLTGSVHLFGDGKHVADEIRQRIKFELGVTASVGVSYNKIFAKLGSDMQKPDATTVITCDNFKSVVWPLSVKELLYVGRATNHKLQRYAIYTIGDLANANIDMLHGLLGKNGLMLWRFANGLDTSPVSDIGAQSLIKSIGNSTTAPRDLVTDDDVKIIMYILSESVASRMRDYDFQCATVQIHLRDHQLFSFERQGRLPFPTCTAGDIFQKAYTLYLKNKPNIPLRSIGVRACQLSVVSAPQYTFLPELARSQKTEALERTIDQLRGRFGHTSIQRGIMLQDRELSHLDPKNDHIIHPVAFLS